MNNNSNKTSYKVKDVSRLLNISRTATYEFINDNPPFQVLHVGKSIRIPQDSFDKWFNGSSEDTNATKSTQKGGR